MALTITRTGPEAGAAVSIGDMLMSFADITADNSYPTGGYAVTPANVGFASVIHSVSFGGVTPQGYAPAWNQSTQKVQFFTSNGAGPAALAEVPNTTNISTATARAAFIGQ